MPSLIPGFEYDIFISYRHKDNKYDGWVTEFVTNLKKELEATFKDDISIYFDFNSHDGLLETHDVDKSLEGKLKCLIFIPILSQTYCDPKSFAWLNEFCAFNKLANQDEFGRDIKLTNGNITSRILPVKIHELDFEDRELIESETGGILRSIDFIFKSAGVNRPLRAIEDHPQDNNYKTFYRDQINKVANATKEIIIALKNRKQVSQNISVSGDHAVDISTPLKRKVASLKNSYFGPFKMQWKPIAIFFCLCLIVFSTIEYFRHYKLSNSIAVLPLISTSGNSGVDFTVDLLTDELISGLAKIPSLDVRPITSVLQYKSTGTDVSSVASSLRARYMLIIRTAPNYDSITLSLELVDVEHNKVIWNKRYDSGLSDITPIKDDIIQGTLAALKPVLSESEIRIIEINKLYQTARFYWNKRTVDGFIKAIAYYNQILEKDPNFAPAYAGLADCYLLLTYYGSKTAYSDNFVKAKEFALKAITLDDDLAEAHTSLGMILYEFDFDIDAADKEFKKAIKLNPNYATAHQWYAELLASQGKFDESILMMQRAEELDPLSRIIKADLGLMYYYASDYTRSVEQHQKALKLDPNFVATHWYLGQTYIAQGNYTEAINSLNNALSLGSDNTRILACLSYAYAMSGNIEEAKKIHASIVESEHQGKYVSSYEMALIYTGFRNFDKAFEELNKAFDSRPFDLVVMNVEPMLDPLRTDSRFELCVEKIRTASHHQL